MESGVPKPKGQSLKVSCPETREFWEIPVLYEDEDLLCLDKPSGLAISSSSAALPFRASLMPLLHSGISSGKPWATARGLSYLMYANRLDTEASGVLLFAKSKPVLVRLLDLFGSGKAMVSFIALAAGAPAAEQFTVDAKLAAHPATPDLVRIDSRHGKRSSTQFHVVERFDGWTLLRATPKTHRLHQVRVHANRAGLRMAADETYGGKPLWLSKLKRDYHLKPGHSERPLIGQVSLHADELSLPHPSTHSPLLIQSPWPKDLQVGLKYLRKYAAI